MATKTAFDKKLYWERRSRGLTGQVRSANIHNLVKDDEGNIQRIPARYKAPSKNRR